MNDITALLIAALFIGVTTLIIAMIARFLGRFNEETRRIAGKMRRAQDSNEYIYWQSELRRHYIRLLPFVSEKTAGRIYSRLFRKPKHYAEKSAGEKHGDGLFHILAPSVLSVCLCAICLCGMSWAWFTATGSAGVSSIQAANYEVTVTATPGATTSTNEDGTTTMRGATVTSGTNGTSTVTFNSVEVYSVTITAAGNATNGYCQVNFGGTEYYTKNLLPKSTLTFTVNAAANTELKVTPQWGTYTPEGKSVIENDGSIGDPIAQSSGEDAQTLDSTKAVDEESEAVSNDATVLEAAAVTDSVQNDSAMSEQSTPLTQTQSQDEAVTKEPANKESAKEETVEEASPEETKAAASTENNNETPAVETTTDSAEAVENLGSDE